MKRPFVIASGTTSVSQSLFASLTADGVTGWGEHAPSKRVTGEGFEDVRVELEELLKNPEWVDRILEDPTNMPGGAPRPGARNALTSAWVDWRGKQDGVGAHRVLNLPEGRIASSVTIGIDEPKLAVRSAQAYVDEGWGCFKVKLGGPHDEQVVDALRDRFPDVPMRVDANEGWTLEKARKMFARLERLDVQFVEQPLGRDAISDLVTLQRESDLPVFLDESILNVDDLLSAIAAEAGDGVVIKLAKCGGLIEARRMVKVARDAGWKIMVGCMIESSAGIAAGAALAGIVDFVDLDGNALISNDPFSGLSYEGGRVTTPTEPGLGITRNAKGAKLSELGH